MTRVYAGIGSNVDRDTHIRAAVRLMAESFGRLLLSSVYESPAYGFEGDNFYNLVTGFDTAMDLPELAARLREIEYACGRQRQEGRFLPRTVDIDLLLFGNTIRHDDDFDLPRVDIVLFAFVLWPLSEIAAVERHPGLGRTYAELWRDFDGKKNQIRPVRFSFTG
ncbi:MAG: 2-amino-4-hydroxy-6-hydroxymethyldihydropteridine diphosphokinase [Gammaproteobacteria bacterium]